MRQLWSSIPILDINIYVDKICIHIDRLMCISFIFFFNFKYIEINYKRGSPLQNSKFWVRKLFNILSICLSSGVINNKHFDMQFTLFVNILFLLLFITVTLKGQ